MEIKDRTPEIAVSYQAYIVAGCYFNFKTSLHTLSLTIGHYTGRGIALITYTLFGLRFS